MPHTSEVTIVLPDGSNVFIPTTTPESTCGEIIYKLLSGKPEEKDIEHYRLVEVKRPYDVGTPTEKVLAIDQRMSSVLAEWDSYYTRTKLLDVEFTLKLVNLENGVTINFNNYLRMTTGVAETSFKMYCSSSTTVTDVLDTVFTRLRMTKNLDKFGLFGAKGIDDTEELSLGDLVLDLHRQFDNADPPTFFQFQIKEDLSGLMGQDYEGYLEKEGAKVKSWKMRWFVLKGSSLFYYKDPKDSQPLGVISNLDKADISLSQPEKASFLSRPKGQHFFAISLPDRTWKLAAMDPQSITGWIEAIRAAQGRRLRDEATAGKKSKVTVKKISNSSNADNVRSANAVNVQMEDERRDGLEIEQEAAVAKARVEQERLDARPFERSQKSADAAVHEVQDFSEDEAEQTIQGISTVDASFGNMFEEETAEDIINNATNPNLLSQVITQKKERPISKSAFDTVTNDLMKSIADLDDF